MSSDAGSTSPAQGQHEGTVRPADDRQRAERYNVADRRRLVDILEDYGVAVAGFDGLRSDAYEKHVASRSLAELETVYRALLRPSAAYEEIQKACPPWHKGEKSERPPGMTSLRLIKLRIMSDFSVREKVRSRGFMAARDQEGGEPVEKYTRAATEIIGEELLGAKMEGKPMLENLKGFDQLLKAGSLRVREQRETRGNARLEWERQGKPIEKGPESKVQGPKPEQRQETLHEKFMRIYGVDPFTDEGRAKLDAEKRAKKGPKANVQPVTGSMIDGNQRDAGARPANGATQMTNQTNEKFEIGNLKRETNGTGTTKAGGAEGQNQRDAGPKPVTGTDQAKNTKTKTEENPKEQPAAEVVAQKPAWLVEQERRQRAHEEEYERQKAQLREEPKDWDMYFNPYYKPVTGTAQG